MAKKPEYCLEKVAGSRVVCAGCYETTPVKGLDPLNKAVLDATMVKIEAEGRVRKCTSCSHDVVICPSCKRDMADEDVVICCCCLNAEISPEDPDEDPELWCGI